MSTKPQNKLPLSDSQFNMWRCVIAIAHADGKLQPEELEYLERVFARLDQVHGLTPEQKNAFSRELAQPRKIADLLPLVTEPQFRGALIHFGEVLAWADNEVSVDEENILKSLRAEHLGKMDMDTLRAEVKNEIATAAARHDAEMKALKGKAAKSPIVRAIDWVLDELGRK